jgi:hypothetical protein
MFLAMVEAEQRGDDVTASYIEGSIMSENLKEAIAYWRTSDADTPFDDAEDNPYTVAAFDEADRLQAESDQALADAAEAGDKGDAYDLAGVLLAVALFIGGIGTLFRKPVLSAWLLAVGAVALVAGTVVAVTA